MLKKGDKAKFKNKNPNVLLEVIDINKGLVTLFGVENKKYFACCSENELIKVEQRKLNQFGPSAEKEGKTRRNTQWI